jgi:hypothetical protein
VAVAQVELLALLVQVAVAVVDVGLLQDLP